MVNSTHHVSRKTFSLFCAINHQALLLKEWLSVTEGETSTARRFIGFMKTMCARLPRNSILILDNARIHRTPAVFTFFSTIPQQVVFLPPYSPDYNPIELVFGLSKLMLKNHLGRESYVPLLVDNVFSKITAAQLSSFVNHCRRLWIANNEPIIN